MDIARLGGITACVLGHFFAKWAISYGGLKACKDGLRTFSINLAMSKKKFKLCSNWIEVKMIGASWRHFVPDPFWPLWNRPDLESAPISSFSNRWLQASRRWEPRSFDVTSIWCIALMTNYLVTKQSPPTVFRLGFNFNFSLFLPPKYKTWSNTTGLYIWEDNQILFGIILD